MNYELHREISKSEDDTKVGNKSTCKLEHLQLQTGREELMDCAKSGKLISISVSSKFQFYISVVRTKR